jgi:hypothetical protein
MSPIIINLAPESSSGLAGKDNLPQKTLSGVGKLQMVKWIFFSLDYAAQFDGIMVNYLI